MLRNPGVWGGFTVPHLTTGEDWRGQRPLPNLASGTVICSESSRNVVVLEVYEMLILPYVATHLIW